ncbi:MAG: hypothetical protein M3275_13105 [Thermoproteota archaeon]|nr:hypothetical protein [Thermoproteota archaeon]
MTYDDDDKDEQRRRFDIKWRLSRVPFDQLEDVRARIPRLLEENKQINDKLAIEWQRLTFGEYKDANFEEQQDLYVIEAALKAYLQLIDKEIKERRRKEREKGEKEH